MTYDDKLRQQIKDELLNLDELDQHNVQFSEQIIAETDWENEWKNYFHPFRASKKFTIVPSWETYAKEADEELCIELDQVWLWNRRSSDYKYVFEGNRNICIATAFSN